ncbi:VOC family protein [Bacillales bacterium AN1005]
MLIKLNWITLRVSNLENSLAFYNGKLGLPIQRRFESRGRQIAMLGIENETKLELIEGSESILKPEAGISIGYEVNSLEEAVEQLKTLDIPIIRGQFSPILICALFTLLTQTDSRYS